MFRAIGHRLWLLAWSEYMIHVDNRTVKAVHNSEHILFMDDTKLFRVIKPRAQDRLLWNALLTKPREADTS